MKNTIRHIGITTVMAIIAFALIGCGDQGNKTPNGSENDNGGTPANGVYKVKTANITY
jgi:hypothetical protein